MIRVAFENISGELDSRQVATAAQAAQAAAEMILSAGELYNGDKIVVSGQEEGEG